MWIFVILIYFSEYFHRKMRIDEKTLRAELCENRQNGFECKKYRKKLTILLTEWILDANLIEVSRN